MKFIELRKINNMILNKNFNHRRLIMYNQQLLQQVAGNCPEYEAITVAQNFGASILNNLQALEEAQCDACINWQDGNCDIFQKHHKKYL